jgi:hypothetical protein
MKHRGRALLCWADGTDTHADTRWGKSDEEASRLRRANARLAESVAAAREAEIRAAVAARARAAEDADFEDYNPFGRAPWRKVAGW